MPSNPVPQMKLYRDWLARERGLSFADYGAMWSWSVSDLEAFWRSIWDYHTLASPTPWARALTKEQMPGAVWFEGAQMNYAQQVLRHVGPAHAAGQPAIIAENEQGESRELSWPELRRQIASLALTLRDLGVKRGERVVAYLPNGPEAIIAMLSCASIGAVWSICAPDMGTPAVVDRFSQVTPKVLIAADGVHYAGRPMDRSATVAGLRQALPTIQNVILLETPYATSKLKAERTFAEAVSRSGADIDAFEPEWLPFDHPLWILYSSGTTGLPKPLVHSHGGVILTALAGGKHGDLGASYDPNTLGERFHWYSSTGWVMWNSQLAGLLSGTTICIYDGSPSGPKDKPDWSALWRFAARNKVTFFGAGAAFYTNCMKAGLELKDCGDLSRIRAIGSTGSPLPPDVQDWGTAQFASIGTPNIWWSNISGGTDIAACFVGGNRELPLDTGRMQCRQLGVATEAWNDEGKPVIGEVGELVCTRPLPSMPIYFWGDDRNERYLSSYFDTYPGIWRHGDWLTIHDDGSCSITGRSDATINRNGVRMGTSEIYAAVERLDDVLDSMVIELERGNGESDLVMFLVLREGVPLDADLRASIAASIRASLSPRFVPDEIIVAPGIPRTLSGKKQELPIKRLYQGRPIEKIINRDAMANPDVLDWYAAQAAARASST
ncbi:MAG TPA: acetoacetate--CoA ligase [Hyphomonadaceae bacterium]|nr:acetoacetate--CoA ligase [Hyphomonadaceae bacterium]HPN04334.1 acetoacetate--CoA ligase [Hyphomonadaceae bacterium]